MCTVVPSTGVIATLHSFRSRVAQFSPLVWLTATHAAISVAGWAHAVHAGTRPGILLAAGQLAGLLLASLALAQLLIMSRSPWFEQRHGLDGLARVHHRIGQVFLVPMVAHPLLIVAAYGQGNARSLGEDLKSILQMDIAVVLLAKCPTLSMYGSGWLVKEK